MALKAFGIAALLMLVLDGLWLGVVARNFYQTQLGGLMREKFLIAPAALFYLIFVGALTALVILPAMGSGGWQRAAMMGAVLGLVAYGTYDLTNYATLKSWPVMLTVVDLAWGTALSAMVAGGTAALLKRWS